MRWGALCWAIVVMARVGSIHATAAPSLMLQLCDSNGSSHGPFRSWLTGLLCHSELQRSLLKLPSHVAAAGAAFSGSVPSAATVGVSVTGPPLHARLSAPRGEVLLQGAQWHALRQGVTHGAAHGARHGAAASHASHTHHAHQQQVELKDVEDIDMILGMPKATFIVLADIVALLAFFVSMGCVTRIAKADRQEELEKPMVERDGGKAAGIANEHEK